jgi:hypothetical protein
MSVSTHNKDLTFSGFAERMEEHWLALCRRFYLDFENAGAAVKKKAARAYQAALSSLRAPMPMRNALSQEQRNLSVLN